MATHFIADTHFGHKNILKHCPKRPWTTVEEMDAALITAWNEIVAVDDEIYHLGDFSFMGRHEAGELLDRLNGYKFLVPGNHDKVNQHVTLGWEDVLPPIHELKTQTIFGEMRFVLCHYPMMTWNKAHHGVLHLHGHSHGNIEQSSTRFDVGIDGVPTWLKWDYGWPISDDLIAGAVMSAKHEYDKVDHH